MARSHLRTAALALAVAAAVTACGGDDDEGDAATTTSGAGGGETVRVGALDSLEFDAQSYRASAGEITFEYENEGNIPHTLLIEGRERDLNLKVTSQGDTDTGSVTLEPGTYVLYCDISGHQAAGMEADLEVS